MIEIIELWPAGAASECIVCGDDSGRCGIPVYEDLVLPNWWPGEWGGAPACYRCQEFQGRLAWPIDLATLQGLVARL